MNDIAPPGSTPEYMYPAWVSCLLWAIANSDILDAFRQQTGCVYLPAKNALDALIDESSGRTESVVRQFVYWFNENIWGEIDGSKQI